MSSLGLVVTNLLLSFRHSVKQTPWSKCLTHLQTSPERVRCLSSPPEGDPIHLPTVFNLKQTRSSRSLQQQLPLFIVSIANINTLLEGLVYYMSTIRSLRRTCWLAVIIRNFWKLYTVHLKALLVIVTAKSGKNSTWTHLSFKLKSQMTCACVFHDLEGDYLIARNLKKCHWLLFHFYSLLPHQIILVFKTGFAGGNFESFFL